MDKNQRRLILEKMDKSRYNLIKWFTIGWAIWFGGFIIKDWISSKLVIVLIILIGLIGWVLFSINLLRLIKFGKIVNANRDLKNALNDELIVHNRNKSFVIGFWTFSILTVIFFGLSEFTGISALIVCEIALFTGTLSVLVSSLIYNRN